MGNGTKGRSGPASATLNHHHNQAALVDRELLALEKRKLVELSSGRIRLTRAGYLELARKFPRRRS